MDFLMLISLEINRNNEIIALVKKTEGKVEGKIVERIEKFGYYAEDLCNNKMKEIYLIIEESGILHPVEIKKTASPDKGAIKAFPTLKSAGRTMGNGAVICMSDVVLPMDENNIIVPSTLI